MAPGKPAGRVTGNAAGRGKKRVKGPIGSCRPLAFTLSEIEGALQHSEKKPDLLHI